MMPSPTFRTEVFGNRSNTTTVEHKDVFNIGPWPVKRSKSEGEAITQASLLQNNHPGLSFSETMAQIDEVYAMTKEMDESEKIGMHSLVSHLEGNDRVFPALNLL